MVMPGMRKTLIFGFIGLVAGVLGAIPGELFLRLTEKLSGLEVCLLIDCSGSMAGTKFWEVKKAAKQFVQKYASEGSIAVVGFESNSHLASPPTREVAALQHAIDRLVLGSSTAMHKGIAAAERQLSGTGSRYLILFTDGMPDSEVEALRAAKEARARGITIVALGTVDAKREYLQRLTGDPSLCFEASVGKFGEAFHQAEQVISGLLETSGGRASVSMTLRVAGWTASLGVALAIALIIGQNRYVRRRLLTVGQGVLGIGGGLFCGVVAGVVGQLLFAAMPRFLPLDVAGRLAGWILLGVLLGFGMAFFVPNLKVIHASIGGGVGGAIGAAGFILLAAQVGDLTGRFAGAAALGLSIGLMIALAELAFRGAWLEIAYGPQESCTVTLGRKPVSIGSDATTCTIYARNAPPVAYRFRLKRGRILCHDVVVNKEETLQPGAQKQAGQVTAVVRAVGAAQEVSR